MFPRYLGGHLVHDDVIRRRSRCRRGRSAGRNHIRLVIRTGIGLFTYLAIWAARNGSSFPTVLRFTAAYLLIFFWHFATLYLRATSADRRETITHD